MLFVASGKRSMFIDKPASHYPLIVIGSGPAGMTVAHSLVNEHNYDRVLMIESGAMQYKPEINRLSLVDATGDLSDEYFATHSIRSFGGTSMVWAGLCSVIEPLAFNNGEWPFPHETLMPYYRRALPILELPESAVTDYEKPVHPDSSFVYRPFYLSAPVRFGEKYLDFAASSPALDVLLETTVRKISHADGRVTGVTIGNSEADAQSIMADKIVLACGGIGNPRLLLLSGLDASGQVGKHLMEHPHVYSYNKIVLKGDAITSTHGVSGERTNAFTLTESAIRDAGIRSFTMSTGPKADAGLEPNTSQGTVTALMTIQAEMAPMESNQVALGNQVDDIGQPKAKVNFKFHADELFPALWRAAGEHTLRENLGRFTAPGPVNDLTGGGHLMGTTRMGKDEGTACVNENGELFGCRSLYVAGSSVFPAGGAANPTFTIVALSLKLADHIAGATP